MRQDTVEHLHFLQQLGKDLETHHSLYEGTVYDDRDCQKEVDAMMCHFPHPSSIVEGA